MKLVRMALTAIGFAVGLASTASAQTVGIATTPAGSFTNSTGAAIAKVIADHTRVRAVVQASAGHALQGIDQGAIELGINNYFDVLLFVKGIEDYAGTGEKRTHASSRAYCHCTLASWCGMIPASKASQTSRVSESEVDLARKY